MDNTVSFVIPAYNESQGIGDVLAQIRALYPDAEIIVVDDGSSDDTATASGQVENIRVIRHAYNLGNGAAVKTGIRATSGDIILLMDGDGQHQPSDISRLLSPIINDGFSMAVGARTPESETELHRDLANRLYNTLAAYLVQHQVDDLTSGFRAIRATIAKEFVNILPNGFSYPTTLTLALFRSGFTVKYVPIVAVKRAGKSKIKLLWDGLGFLLTLMRIGTLFAPLRIFIPAALVLLSMGVGYGAYLLIFHHRFTNTPPLLILSGILLFMMGLISEQIALLRLMQVGGKGEDCSGPQKLDTGDRGK